MSEQIFVRLKILRTASPAENKATHCADDKFFSWHLRQQICCRKTATENVSGEHVDSNILILEEW